MIDMTEANTEKKVIKVTKAEYKKIQKAEKKKNRAAAWKIWAIVLLSIADVVMFFVCAISLLIVMIW